MLEGLLQQLLYAGLPMIATFLIGLVMKSPIYQKGKKLIDEVDKALEDDKLSKAEIQRLWEIVKKKS